VRASSQSVIKAAAGPAAAAENRPYVGFADVAPARRDQLGLPHEHELLQVRVRAMSAEGGWDRYRGRGVGWSRQRQRERARERLEYYTLA
jgi:hypothetical protein